MTCNAQISTDCMTCTAQVSTNCMTCGAQAATACMACNVQDCMPFHSAVAIERATNGTTFTPDPDFFGMATFSMTFAEWPASALMQGRSPRNVTKTMMLTVTGMCLLKLCLQGSGGVRFVLPVWALQWSDRRVLA